MIKRALIGLTFLLLVVASPPLLESLVALDPVLPSLLFTLGLLGAASRWHARTRRRHMASRALRRLEARAGRALGAWGWAPAILLFLLPIYSHWSGRPPSGVTAFSALLGRVPWGDAQGHAEGGYRLLAEGEFGPYSERRPLNASWLAVRLAACRGRLDHSLLAQAALFGFSAYLLCNLVGTRFGLSPALGSFGLLLGLARAHLPTADTEPLGETLGCFGLVLLLSFAARQRLSIYALGLFVVDAALQARPGPQLLLPLLIVFGVSRFKHQALRAAALLLAAAAASSILTQSLNSFYGSGQASFTTYPAYTFYGLTHGGNYKTAELDLAAEIGAAPSEHHVARLLYSRAWKRFMSEPLILFESLGRNSLRFILKIPTNLGSIVNLRAFVVQSDVRARPPEKERFYNRMLGLPPLLFACLALIARLIRSRDRDGRRFWTAVALGVLCSVPFVYGDAGFRGLAAAYPFLSVGLCLGLSHRLGREPRRTSTKSRDAASVSVAIVLSLSLLFASLVGPMIAHRFWPRPDRRALAESHPGTTMIVSRETTTSVLVANFRGRNLNVPVMELDDFLRVLALADLGESAAAFRDNRLPFAILSVYDFVSRAQQTVIAPLAVLHEEAGFIRLKVRPIQASAPLFEAIGFERIQDDRSATRTDSHK
ncbi:MAG: hypothetical protein JXO72_06515 [Vicinamibacteria bacterium]|nr:hypothetical protein [Vicinamibacteria bacterium]